MAEERVYAQAQAVIAPRVVQTAAAGNSGTGGNPAFGVGATAGNLLLGFAGSATNNASVVTFPSGWVDSVFHNHTTGGGRSVATGHRLSAAGGETTITIGNQASSGILEVSGLVNPNLDSSNGNSFTNDTTPTVPTLTPTPGYPAIIVIAQFKQPATPNPGPQTISGFTAGPDSGYAGFGSRYRLTTWYKVVGVTSGSYGGMDLSASTDGSEDGSIMILAFLGDTGLVTDIPRVGQAQAFITKPNVHGQARAWIENTYRGHAQARARIIYKQNGVGQAEAFIVTLPMAYGQTQALILTTVNRHGQAQASILQTYTQYGQAQGNISAIAFTTGQAQGLILGTGLGVAQAQATILVTTNVHGQGQASIKQTYYQFGQAQGTLATKSNVVAQAQAQVTGLGLPVGQSQGQIKQTYYAVAQAQAEIPAPPGNEIYVHGQAQAYIFATIFLDTFTKTVANVTVAGDLNPPDIGYDYRSVAGSQDLTLLQSATPSVNGNQIQITETVANYEGYNLLNRLTRVYNFEMSGDFYASAVSVEATWGFISVRNNSNTNVILLQMYDGLLTLDADTVAQVAFVPIAGTTYRLKIQRIGTVVKAKAWDVTAAEPEWMLTDALTSTSPLHPVWYQDIGETGPITVRGDNFRVLSDTSVHLPHGLARAFIYAPKAHAQAGAQIKQIYRGHGQARAKISTTRTYGQARARIKRTYFKFAQAQALITGTVKNVYGQSNALIDSIAKVQSGQANAKIDNPSYYLVDDFNRVGTLEAFPTPDYGPDWLNSGDVGAAILDGDDLTITGTPLTYPYIDLQSPINAKNIDAYFEVTRYHKDDFFIVSVRSLVGVGIISILANTNDTWTIQSYNNSTATFLSTLVYYALDFGVRYSFRIYVKESTLYFKIWKTEEPEPFEWIASLEVHALNAGSFEIALDIAEAARTTYIHTINIKKPATEQHGQAQALIASGLNIYTAHGQAQATMLGYPHQHGQAQARIHRPEGYGQAQAQIEAQGARVAQANAYIIRRARWFAQAQAHIATNYPAVGQAQAQITTTVPTGQAQAFIVTTFGLTQHGQAQAEILNGTVIVLDTFSRVTSLGEEFGYPDIGPKYANVVNNIPWHQESYLDGSKGVVTVYGSVYGVSAFSPIWGQDIVLSIDLMSEVFTEDANFFTLRGRYRTSTSPEFSAYHDSGDDTTSLYLDGITEGLSSVEIPNFEPNVWYTAELSIVGTVAKGRVYESGTEPPDWQIEGTTTATYGAAYFQSWSGFDEGGPDYNLYFDNWIVSGTTFDDGSTKQVGQAQARIKRTYRAHGQARAQITNKMGFGQAAARITDATARRHGQARARIKRQFTGTGQAQAYMVGARYNAHGQARAFVRYPMVHAQAAAFIRKTGGSGQAQAVINAFGQRRYGQARAFIRRTDTLVKSGQAQGYIRRRDPIGQAQAFISGGRYLVKYNGYQLPGWAGTEAMNSITRINSYESPYEDLYFMENVGLDNKLLSLEHVVKGETYLDAKNQVQQAATIVKSKRGWAKLYIQRGDRYYEAMNSKITTEKVVGSTMRLLRYRTEFEVKPWLTSDAEYSISGTGTIDTDTVGRTIDNGGWTEAKVILSGTEVTVSGYTEFGDFAGFISVSGTVTGLVIENGKATIDGINSNEYLRNANFRTYVGPGKTIYEITGGNVEIKWHDRWYL